MDGRVIQWTSKRHTFKGTKWNAKCICAPPPEFDSGSLWCLKKNIYGLCDTARQWYASVKDQLMFLGASISSLEPALFSWKSDGNIEGVMCVYVDDFLWAGIANFKCQAITQQRKVFQVGASDSECFKYEELNIVATVMEVFLWISISMVHR